MRKNLSILNVMVFALSGMIMISALGQYTAPRRPAQPRRTVEGRLDRSKEEAGGQVTIRKLIGTGPQTTIRTPEFRTNIQKSGSRSQDWAQISVEYDAFPEWIDVLTFRYFVMSGIRRDGEKHYSIYQKTVEYIDVEEGRRKLSSVYLRPATVKRQGEPVAVHVEIMIEGKVVATEDDINASMKGKLPEDWWENRDVIQKETVTVHNDRLLNRAETPFALVNIDDYEVIR